jgi:hypothetical protein
VNDHKDDTQTQQDVNRHHRYVESDEGDQPSNEKQESEHEPHTILFPDSADWAPLLESDVRLRVRFALEG